MSKSNLRGITLAIRPVWWIKSLTLHSLLMFADIVGSEFVLQVFVSVALSWQFSLSDVDRSILPPI